MVTAGSSPADRLIACATEPLDQLQLMLNALPARSWPRIRTLMARYERMDLADASIVVMSGLHKRAQVLTVDRTDFTVYRRNDRQ